MRVLVWRLFAVQLWQPGSLPIQMRASRPVRCLRRNSVESDRRDATGYCTHEGDVFLAGPRWGSGEYSRLLADLEQSRQAQSFVVSNMAAVDGLTVLWAGMLTTATHSGFWISQISRSKSHR